MGYGRWDDGFTSVAYSSNVATRSVLDRNKIFTKRGLSADVDPSKVVVRESRDSDHNPTSNAIIVGLDVTGSMGIIAEEMARGALGKLMEGIFEHRPVVDPQVMIMGIGDIHYDDAPLQVSQFEADIRIDKSLQDLFLEGGGGGNTWESYDLAWYFAALKTSIDCFEKRGRKGYLFTIGDELPPADSMEMEQLTTVLGPMQGTPLSRDEALALAQEKYHVFHIIVEQGSYARPNPGRVVSAWREILGARALPLANWEHVPEVIIAAMELSEGISLDDVIAKAGDDNIVNTLKHAFG